MTVTRSTVTRLIHRQYRTRLTVITTSNVTFRRVLIFVLSVVELFGSILIGRPVKIQQK